MGASLSNASTAQGNKIVVLPVSSGYLQLDHGMVVADYAWNTSGTKTQSSLRNFYITDISLRIDTDPTTEIAIQQIPISILVYKTLPSVAQIWQGTGGIPNGTNWHFTTPLRIPKGITWHTRLKLGGATNLSMQTVCHGYESIF